MCETRMNVLKEAEMCSYGRDGVQNSREQAWPHHVSDPHTVEVTLDFETAHPKLIVSDDMKSVRLLFTAESILLSVRAFFVRVYLLIKTSPSASR